MSKALVRGSATSQEQIGLHFSHWRRVPPLADGWLDVVHIWSARSRQRIALGELAELDDHFLKDIGVSRDEAMREAAKPFWRR